MSGPAETKPRRGPGAGLRAGKQPAGLDRLRRQSAELAGHSAMLLDPGGLAPGTGHG